MYDTTKAVHQPVIDTMSRLGFGLLKNGETFYQKGYELDISLGITFSMHQAYEIHKHLLQAYSEGAGRVLGILEELHQAPAYFCYGSNHPNSKACDDASKIEGLIKEIQKRMTAPPQKDEGNV
jgi:hypothetical protein